MLIKNVLLNTLFLFFFVTLGKWGTLQVGHCSTKTSTFVEQSPWNNPGIFAHFFALSRPRISVYKRGRDAACYVRKREDELAGQARKDTDSEPFANDE